MIQISRSNTGRVTLSCATLAHFIFEFSTHLLYLARSDPIYRAKLRPHAHISDLRQPVVRGSISPVVGWVDLAAVYGAVVGVVVFFVHLLQGWLDGIIAENESGE